MHKAVLSVLLWTWAGAVYFFLEVAWKTLRGEPEAISWTMFLLAILALMPAEAQTGIKAVDKLTSAGSKSSTINTSSDKLFLLSEIEISGSITNSKSGEGSQYAYYSAGNSKVKNFGGSATHWWERSPYGGGSTSFCLVNSAGTAASSGASTLRGVAFGFCF